ncbi:hypothetical protein F4779DRAFT_346319 [Xylariaceae sp. FL0662B]|nr:hypothetical protein F4779DRAFT_346319 [Xylariaceae sp. FL0662B]
MSHPPSTPVKVPAAAATYTPATLDTDLRSQINALLLREGHINKIQEHFLHNLNAHPSNWPSSVQAHALSLLRSGEVSTFPALVRRVLEDVRRDTAAAAATTAAAANNETASTTSTHTLAAGTGTGAVVADGVNGASSANGTKKGVNGTAAAGNGGGVGGGSTDGASSSSNTNSLAVPPAVVDAVLKVARDSLDAVCEIDDGASSSTGG